MWITQKTSFGAVTVPAFGCGFLLFGLLFVGVAGLVVDFLARWWFISVPLLAGAAIVFIAWFVNYRNRIGEAYWAAVEAHKGHDTFHDGCEPCGKELQLAELQAQREAEQAQRDELLAQYRKRAGQ